MAGSSTASIAAAAPDASPPSWANPSFFGDGTGARSAAACFCPSPSPSCTGSIRDCFPNFAHDFFRLLIWVTLTRSAEEFRATTF